jgi:VCBS repeat-containing protein
LKRTSKNKPFWERAYKGHAFWLGKTKLGKVTLAAKGHYTWQAAGRAGEAADLDKANKAVEMEVLIADKQMDLFNG